MKGLAWKLPSSAAGLGSMGFDAIRGQERSLHPTKLMRAAFAGRPWLVRALLLFSDVDAVNWEGLNALHWAAIRGRLDCVKVLVRRINPSGQNEFGGKMCSTPLHFALSNGNFAVASFLAPLTDAKLVDEWGSTPLALAAVRGSVDLVRLLHPRSDPLAVDKRGFTALMAAAHWSLAGHHDSDGGVAVVDELLRLSGDFSKHGMQAATRLNGLGDFDAACFIMERVSTWERENLAGLTCERFKQTSQAKPGRL